MAFFLRKRSILILHYPKTAGTSLGKALWDQGEIDTFDWWLFAEEHSHKPFGWYREVFGHYTLSTLKVFGIVRHPFDILLSEWCYKRKLYSQNANLNSFKGRLQAGLEEAHHLDFPEWCEWAFSEGHLLGNDELENHLKILVKGMAHFYDGGPIILSKFETGLDKFVSDLGLHLTIPTLNVSQSLALRHKYYSLSTLRSFLGLQECYQRDLHFYRYNFD